MTETIEADVAIVGAGPVGLCLAADLGARGVACAVVEQRARGAATFPTANHVSVRTMEHLRRLGVSKAVQTAFRPDWGGDWIALTHLGGHEVARVADALADTRDRADSPEREVWAPKPCFDPILLATAEQHAATHWLYGTRIESVEQNGDEARCVGARRDGARVRVRARWVVGCDGANSATREACGIETLAPPPLPVVIHSAFFRSARVAELVPRGGVQYSLLGTPAGPTKTPFGAGIMVSVDGRELWRLHGPGLDAADEATTLARLRALGADDAEVIMMTAWTPAQGLCATYRSGRCLLAGDAAHQVTPYGGLGVNTGIADAFDLSWKIDASLRGWGGARLLDDSYDYERRRAARDLLEYQGVDFSGTTPRRKRPPMPLHDAPDASLWQTGSKGDAARRAYGAGLVASRGDEYDKPQVDLGYRYDGSPIVCDDGSPAPDRTNARRYEATAKPGGRAPHVRLADGRSTLDLFGPGFTLLRTGAAVDPSPFVRAAGDRAIPIKVETAPEASAAYQHALALIRPDGFVAWRGDAVPADVDAVLDRVRGA